MDNLFKKVACCTDLHLGLKNNSIVHNNDCEEFIDWFIAESKKANCETGIFLGDWHNARASINSHTLHYSVKLLEKLGKSFEQFYFITGNHDLYYRDNREVTSVEFSRNFPGVTLVDEIFTAGDVTIVPWLVGDDYKKIKDLKSKYVFGHFELPHFLMNALVRMPDHCELKHDDMSSPDYVFSGHFHKRQQQKNIIYMGNCFPHNYSDAWDDERGMMTLEWGGKPEFKTWNDAPKYRTIKLSQLLEDPAQYLLDKVHMRVTMDIEINYEEANYIKETFFTDFNIRELTLVANQNKTSLDVGGEDTELTFQSVNAIITEELGNIESDFFKPEKLLKIYNNL
jgi:DNA repair exonuclease SbcCD nuclease subunit